MRINKGYLVKVKYQLNDDDGTLIEKTKSGEPLEFIFGMGLMLPAFEAELVGKQVGDHFDFTLTPDEAYGQINEDLKIALEKEAFFIDGTFDSEIVYEGARVPMNTADGQVVEGLVTKITDDKVYMDFNHDLAGMTLHFQGSVVDIHEPSKEEYDHYFGHNCGGSCNCGCETHNEHGSCCESCK